MLRNRRILGEVTWGQREWFKDPVTRRRRSRMVPKEKWNIRQDETLRIIDDELWATVQARHRVQRTPDGRVGTVGTTSTSCLGCCAAARAAAR